MDDLYAPPTGPQAIPQDPAATVPQPPPQPIPQPRADAPLWDQPECVEFSVRQLINRIQGWHSHPDFPRASAIHFTSILKNHNMAKPWKFVPYEMWTRPINEPYATDIFVSAIEIFALEIMSTQLQTQWVGTILSFANAVFKHLYNICQNPDEPLEPETFAWELHHHRPLGVSDEDLEFLFTQVNWLHHFVNPAARPKPVSQIETELQAELPKFRKILGRYGVMSNDTFAAVGGQLERFVQRNGYNFPMPTGPADDAPWIGEWTVAIRWWGMRNGLDQPPMLVNDAIYDLRAAIRALHYSAVLRLTPTALRHSETVHPRR